MKRNPKKIQLVITLFLFLNQTPALTASGNQIEHVVIIAIDCVNPEKLQQANTPNIDTLTATGSYTYDACTVHPAKTISAIPAILTGATQDVHQLYEWTGTMQAESIVEMLEESGYTCAMIGESENLGGYAATYNTGFEVRQDHDDHYFNIASEWLSSYEPFFMFIYNPIPDRVGHQYGHESVEYLDALETADYHVGSIMDTLHEMGGFDDTLFVVTTDHSLVGTSHSRGPIFSIWKGPGIKQGYTMDSKSKYVSGYGWVSHSLDDVAPTVTDILGLRAPMDITGESFSDQILVEGFLDENVDELIEEIILLNDSYRLLFDDYEVLLGDYQELNETYFEVLERGEALEVEHEALQEDYYELESRFFALENRYEELQESQQSGIPGFPLFSILIGMMCLVLVRLRESFEPYNR